MIRTRTTILTAGLATLLAFGGSAASMPPGESAESAAMHHAEAHEAPGLEQLRSMAGEWVRLGEDGAPTDELVARYRVTAGGSAVVETLFPGTDKEMVTVYHSDGDALMLTHYCVLGNQPRMRAERTTSPERIEFVCVGGTNMASERDHHMHQATLEWVDANHVRTAWVSHENGEPGMTARFDLGRRR